MRRSCRVVASTALVAALAGCGAPPPKKFPDPVWVTESPLASVASTRTVWPDTEWAIALPESDSVARAELRTAASMIEKDLPEVRALLVVVDGRLLFERYFHGAKPDELVNTKSITKSVLSALVGVALSRGELTSVTTPIRHWFAPELALSRERSARDVTLHHALSMTTGFDWQENGPATRDWMQSSSQVRFTLESRMVAAPGERFNYNTGVAHLVGVIVARATATDLATYADRTLFDPMGIHRGPWGRDRQGHCEGGSELHLTARDMARFGLLYLNRGRWRDRQLVPEAWVLESTRPQGREDYGYYWWYLPREWGGPAINALGYGGQVISIVPDANAVIVLASTSSDPSNPVMQVLCERLLPAVRGVGK